MGEMGWEGGELWVGGCRVGSSLLIVKNAGGISCASLSGKRKCSHTSHYAESNGQRGQEGGGGQGNEGQEEQRAEGKTRRRWPARFSPPLLLRWKQASNKTLNLMLKDDRNWGRGYSG